MQVMAKLLKDNNVLQLNIQDPKMEETNIANIETISNENLETKVEAKNQRIDNIGKNVIKSIKKNNIGIKVSTHPSDVVFSILSEDGRKKAMKTVLSHIIPEEERTSVKNKERKPLDSLTFLLQSGYSEAHFARLLSKVLFR